MNVAPALAVMLACSALALPARADGDLPFRLDYRPAPSCPGSEHFTGQLARRTRRLVPAAPGVPALTFVVEVRQAPGGVQGYLWLFEPNGTTTERVVPGSNCVEVLDAMALIAAVSVDPAASLEPEPVRPAPPRPALAPRRSAPASGAAAARPALRKGWGMGMLVNAQANVAPDPLPALGAYVELVGDGAGVWAPFARLALQRAASASIEVPADAPASLRSAHAQLSWLSGRLLGCPVALRFQALAARPCAFFDLGVVNGRGYVAPEQAPASETTVWMAAGGALELELAIRRLLLLGVGVGLGTTLRRGEFYLDPPFAGQRRVRVHEIRALAWHVGSSLGFRFF